MLKLPGDFWLLSDHPGLPLVFKGQVSRLLQPDRQIKRSCLKVIHEHFRKTLITCVDDHLKLFPVLIV